MTDPTQSVQVRRIYYASGTPPIPPVLYDDSYDALPNVDVLDPVLQYDGQVAVQGYTWNGTRQVADSGGGDPIGDALRADCVAYWKFDSNGNDASGNGRNGTPVESPTFVSGKVGNAAHFVGTNSQYFSIANHASLQGAQDFTMAGWVKLNSIASGSGLITKNDNSSTEEYGLYASGVPIQFSASIYTNAASLFVLAGTFGELSVDTYYFVIIQLVSDTKTLSISVNNGDFDSGVFSETLLTSTGELHIGENTFEMDFATADMDEWCRWNRVLTADERAYLYNSSDGRTLYP